MSADESDSDGSHPRRAGICGCREVHPLMVCVALLSITVSSCLAFRGALAAPQLFATSCNVYYAARPDSPSVIASLELWSRFPLLARMSISQVVLTIRSLDAHQTVLTTSVLDFSRNVSSRAKVDPRTRDLEPSVTGYYLGSAELGFLPEDSTLKAGFVLPDESVTVIVFIPKKIPRLDGGVTDYDIRERAVGFLHDFTAFPPSGMEVQLTGLPIMAHDKDVDRSIEALFVAELVTIPLAMLVLRSLVPRTRLLLLPLISLGVSFLTACVFVQPAVEYMGAFSNDIPPAMVSVVIALSLDYSLFMLTRFTENVDKKKDLQANILSVVQETSHTIVVSGMLIAVAFFGAMSIPEVNLQAAGICLGLTTIAILFVSATLIPALLLFFGPALTAPCCGRSPDLVVPARENILSDGYDCSGPSPVRRGGWTLPPLVASNSGERWWLALMRVIERGPRCAVVLVLIMFSPLIVQLLWLHASADAYAVLPDTLPSVQAMRLLDHGGYPTGRFVPHMMLVRWKLPQDLDGWNTMTMPDGRKSAMLCPFAFNALLDLADAVSVLPGVANMLGPVWLMDQRVDGSYSHALQTAVAPPLLRLRRPYIDVLATHVTQQAAVLEVHTAFPSQGPGAADWVQELRRTIEAWEASHPDFVAMLSQGGTEGADIRSAVMESLGTYVGFTVAAVTLLVVCMFRSLLLPIRLAFALLFTLGVTFGIAVVVFQTPLFHSLFPFLANYFGLAYSSVPIAICIGIALGLDYDIFLITRIVELRLLGYSDHDSIVFAVAKTGSIISGAGLIMSLAFSGLLFAAKMMLKQFALLLITSVLLDTFVVRTILVPALMLSAGSWNWWPRRMPEPLTVEPRGDEEDEAGSGTGSEDKA